MKLPVYLDYAATTPIDPQVAEKMIHCLVSDTHFGNPASKHHLGQEAKQTIDQAREAVAALIGAHPTEIIWTSGTTEANNLALKGAAPLYQGKGKHIITVKTEHPSILDCCQHLEKNGFSVTYLTPAANGVLQISQLEQALRTDTILVSIMHVNNEIGTIQDLKRIADITASHGILFHVDAAQSAGKIPIDVQKVPIDLLSFCAHKIYGPKGIGALYVRRQPRVRVAAQIHGGGQEQGMRSGTLPTHQIVGMGVACQLAQTNMIEEYKQLTTLRDYFWHRISRLIDVKLNGDLIHAFPGIINVSFPGHTAENLIKNLPELALSVGSACSSRGTEPSHVLRAIGLTSIEARSALRFSFGRLTCQKDIDYTVEKIQQAINHSP